MLEALKLDRYRGFESYQLADLARVNLLVGKNNCGKTTILEAIELLVSGGHVSALRDSAVRRGEIDEDDILSQGVEVSHVFYGHRCEVGASFELSSSRNLRLEGELKAFDDKTVPVGEIGHGTALPPRAMAGLGPRVPARLGPVRSDVEPPTKFWLSLVSVGQPPIVLPITENGTILDRFGGHTPSNRSPGKEVRFLRFDPSSMVDAWNDVLTEGREAAVVDAMRILMPEIDSIHFLPGRQGGLGGLSKILVGHQDAQQRLPIGSYGAGMLRLLAIGLALASTEDRCLLIDEIDSGLHWTVMEDMWRLVVGAAQSSNVQVFATTHSFDCVKGLGTLIRSRPDLAKHVAVQKVHRSLKQAVCVPGEDIAIAVEDDIEVR